MDPESPTTQVLIIQDRKRQKKRQFVLGACRACKARFGELAKRSIFPQDVAMTQLSFQVETLECSIPMSCSPFIGGFASIFGVSRETVASWKENTTLQTYKAYVRPKKILGLDSTFNSSHRFGVRY
jgi:hypothetical protein